MSNYVFFNGVLIINGMFHVGGQMKPCKGKCNTDVVFQAVGKNIP